ncbi:MAG TPA: stage V sporulation protein SpoVM [Candidatus Butyricicoccus stercorigallinarum]|nr:stage V sporulation protein SpoVM [Candidatus Butyricicoccus stercorigallinarum]
MLKGVRLMKIVVIRSPRLLAGILRSIFGIKKTPAA